MLAADQTGRTGNEAGGYGERLRVGLHFTQPNLPRLRKVASVARKERSVFRGLRHGGTIAPYFAALHTGYG
jgi:hypothetical protein